MTRRLISRVLSAFLFATVVAAGPGQNGAAAAQSPQPAPPAATVADVRQMVADARKEIESYTTGGGAPGGADHPAIKRDAAIWQVRDRAPNSEAGTLAAIEAIRLLVRAALWDRAHGRVESLDADDPAWLRVASVVYEEAVARKSFDYAVATVTRIAAATKTPAIKSAALLIVGRVHRRQGDLPAATRAFEEARAAAPGTPQGEEADGLVYEVAHLSLGLRAPAIAGTPRNARRAITLDSFRGKAVVLVFWSTT